MNRPDSGRSERNENERKEALERERRLRELRDHGDEELAYQQYVQSAEALRVVTELVFREDPPRPIKRKMPCIIEDVD